MSQIKELLAALEELEWALESGELDPNWPSDGEQDSEDAWETLGNLMPLFESLRADRDRLLPTTRDSRWDQMAELFSAIQEGLGEDSELALRALRRGRSLLHGVLRGAPPPLDPSTELLVKPDPLWLQMAGSLFGAVFFGVALPGAGYMAVLFLMMIFGGDPANHLLTSRSFTMAVVYLTSVSLGVLFGSDIRK